MTDLTLTHALLTAALLVLAMLVSRAWASVRRAREDAALRELVSEGKRKARP